MKLRQAFQIAFLVIGTLAALEFLFLRGMFSWLIAVVAVLAVGLANVLLALRQRRLLDALMYVLCSVALCMGDCVLAGF